MSMRQYELLCMPRTVEKALYRAANVTLATAPTVSCTMQ